MPRKKALVEPEADAAVGAVAVDAVRPTAAEVLLHLADLERVYHAKARCRWCKGRFRQVYGTQWLCESDACATRQIDNAMQSAGAIDPARPFIYIPTPAQVDLEDNHAKNVLFGGAAGGSKSFGLRWHLYKWCRKIPGYEAILIRQSYPELESTHLLKMFKEQYILGDAKYKNGDRMMVFSNGSFIKAGHCESESDMGKYLSTEYDEIVFDEASTIRPRPLREISSRARSDAARPEVRERGGAWVRYGTNPGGVSALALKTLFITKDPDPSQVKKYHPEHYGFIRADIEDNPYLEDDYEEARLDALDPDRYEQLRHGNWDVASGQFFATFDMAKHVRAIEVPTW
jgi:hypothetical protein